MKTRTLCNLLVLALLLGLLPTAALAGGIILAWTGAGLLPVSVCCCVIVFVLESFLV